MTGHSSQDHLDAAARKVGSITVKTGQFSGRTFQLWQQNLEDMLKLREYSLQERKRAYLETYTKNVDIIPDRLRDQLLAQAFERAATISYEDLPAKTITMPQFDKTTRKVLVNPHTGQVVTKPQPVEYWMWWASETLSGKLHAAWVSMAAAPSQGQLTFSHVCEIFTDAMGDLNEAVREVGRLSASRLGNESGPSEEETPTASNPEREQFLAPLSENASPSVGL